MGAVLFITGGTGSLGNAIVEKLLWEEIHNFSKIIIYSRDEHKQELMAKKFQNDGLLRFIVGDVRDKARLSIAMRDATHVIHAAALKIVPKGEYNPSEYVQTNIIGTQNVLEALKVHNSLVEGQTSFVLVSTDKAVMPVNLYGATKLAAERLTIAFNNVHGERGPICRVVRYGNVANSNGSVIPIFYDNYKHKKSFPITSREMTRYWITLGQAAEFVLSKLYTVMDYSASEVQIPKMPSFRITDLARAFTNGAPPKIRMIGIRGGEKIHETIDGINYSNTNELQLDWQQLRSELLGLGYQLEYKNAAKTV